MILCKCLSGPWDASVLQLGLLLLALAVVALELVGGLLGDELDEVGKVPAAAVLLGFLERHKTKSINGLFLGFSFGHREIKFNRSFWGRARKTHKRDARTRPLEPNLT